MPPVGTIRETMCVPGTPVEDYRCDYGLWVKREDLSCPPPGPPFSKTRGVFAHVRKRREELIGVLDTSHSQAGHAVARACQILGKRCWNFYPEYKGSPGPRQPQLRAESLGAELSPLPAGRSCILYHAARKRVETAGGYMMPNALKLSESVEETAKEVRPGDGGRFGAVIVPSSSGTIAAGVLRGFALRKGLQPTFVVHLGYSRSHDEVVRYVRAAAGLPRADVVIVDEGYAYKDSARPGPTPPWPCNEYYDLKAFRWWMREGRATYVEALFWNVG